jgi:hypothetical protein
MRVPDTNGPAPEPATIGLGALAWTLSDQPRAERLLALTGLDAQELRLRATDPTLLAAVLDFLGSHEPDLIACADALGLAPAALILARHRLAGDLPA